MCYGVSWVFFIVGTTSLCMQTVGMGQSTYRGLLGGCRVRLFSILGGEGKRGRGEGVLNTTNTILLSLVILWVKTPVL